MKNDKLFDTVVSHAKNSGFVFQGSEIYGGLSNTWDFGPLGVELKENIKKAWWRKFIQEPPYNTGIQSAILMNPAVWVASGHIGGFSDPLMDCKECKARFRADQLIESQSDPQISVEGWSNEAMMEYIQEHQIACPKCGAHNFTDIRHFNLMFKTFQGVVEDAKSAIHLRPETAQGMFVNFKNVQRSTRKKLPFGIGQIGKSFRNEITPGNFIFRTREFEQMELEFFCQPGTDMEWYQYYKEYCMNFLTNLGIRKEHVRFRDHTPDELSFYSNGTCDIEYNFHSQIGWGEVWGISNRTDYDLRKHQDASKKSLEYLDATTNEKYLPYCIEPSVGVERLMLAFLCDAYDEEQIAQGVGTQDDTRIVLHLHPFLAPIKACIMPLSKKLSKMAMQVYEKLAVIGNCEFDEAGSIGKRYRRQDAIGTPFCITIDFETEKDHCVTIRHRDSMEQERVAIDDVVSYMEERIKL